MKRLLVGVLAALPVAAIAQASQPESGELYLSLQSGYVHFDNERQLADDYMFGLAAGRWFDQNWRYELSLQHVNTKHETTQRKFGAQLIDFQLYHEFGFETMGFVPYVTAGVGFLTGPGRPDMESAGRFVNGGLGARYAFGDRYAFQLDYRHSLNRAGGNTYDDNWFLASVSMAFPKKDRHMAHRQNTQRIHQAVKAPVPGVEHPLIFGFDSTEVKGSFSTDWEAIAQYVAQHDDVTLELQGHTDSKGPSTYNEKLGLRRAESVRNLLLEKTNIAEDRVKLSSAGERVPVADNETPEGRALNRRVTATIVPAS